MNININIIIMQQQDEYFWLVSLQCEVFCVLGPASGPEEDPESQEAPAQGVTDVVEASPAGELMLGVAVAQGRRYPGSAPGLSSAHLLAGRTHQAPSVQPVVIIRPQADLAQTSMSVSQSARPGDLP